MRVTHLELKQFRCFKHESFVIDNQFVLFIGRNGTGKSSIVEALHYLCYLRSFRTHRPTDLAKFETDGFFIKADIQEGNESHTLQVGVSGSKRLVKLDQKAIGTYKELLDHYRIITITEDDLALIKGSPDFRRRFIDQIIGLSDYSYIDTMRQCKIIVDNRNALLKQRSPVWDEYVIWTKQLWAISSQIQNERQKVLAVIADKVSLLLAKYCLNEDLQVSFIYKSKNMDPKKPYSIFFDQLKNLYQQEIRFKRSLFGAHLDDYQIDFQGKTSKLFASRGQQKLIVLLVKMAQVQLLTKAKGPVIMLLDDFMTDFDESRVQKLLLALYGLECQLIFTSPNEQGFLEIQLANAGAQIKKLTI